MSVEQARRRLLSTWKWATQWQYSPMGQDPSYRYLGPRDWLAVEAASVALDCAYAEASRARIVASVAYA